jgi:hypothetical protein
MIFPERAGKSDTVIQPVFAIFAWHQNHVFPHAGL